MANCADCGEHVIWARHPPPSVRTHPPLQPTGTAYVIIDGVVRHHSTYQIHHCDAEKVQEHAAFLQGQADLRQSAAIRLREAHAISINHPCPRCKAPRDTPCRYIRDHSRTTVWPHSERGDWLNTMNARKD
jgi:hypothetical protein